MGPEARQASGLSCATSGQGAGCRNAVRTPTSVGDEVMERLPVLARIGTGHANACAWLISNRVVIKRAEPGIFAFARYVGADVLIGETGHNGTDRSPD